MMKNILGQAIYQLTVTFGMMFFGEFQLCCFALHHHLRDYSFLCPTLGSNTKFFTKLFRFTNFCDCYMLKMLGYFSVVSCHCFCYMTAKNTSDVINGAPNFATLIHLTFETHFRLQLRLMAHFN